MFAFRSFLILSLVILTVSPAQAQWVGREAFWCLQNHVELSVEGLDQIDQRGEITITAHNNTNIAFSRIGVRIWVMQDRPRKNIEDYYLDVPMDIGSGNAGSTVVTLPYTRDLLLLLGKGVKFQFQPGKDIVHHNPIAQHYVAIDIYNALDRKGRMIVNDVDRKGQEPIFWPGAQATSRPCVPHYEGDDSASDLFMRFLKKLFD